MFWITAGTVGAGAWLAGSWFEGSWMGVDEGAIKSGGRGDILGVGGIYDAGG